MEELKTLVGSALANYGHKTDEELAVLGYKRKPVEIDTNTKEYWDKIQDAKPRVLSDEQRKQAIKSKLSNMAKNVGKSFSPSNEQVRLMTMLYDYFSGNDNHLDPSKGLLLIGSTGVGKTSIMTAFLSVPFGEFMDNDWYNEKPKMTSCISVVDYYDQCNSSKAYIDWKDKYKGDWYFSDLGSEPKHKYATSDSEPVMSKLLEYRDNRPTGKTYFCTNLSANDLLDKYGQRVVSRIFGSCNAIDLAQIGITKDYRI